MKKQIPILILLFALISLGEAYAQIDVTIRQLNTWENLTATSQFTTENAPFSGQTVRFTAVVVNNPKSSGLASFNSSTGTIGRVHLFVMDTTANSQGRDGMAMQIVESTLDWVENLNRGDVVTFVGTPTVFTPTAQFDLLEAPVLLGTVGLDFPEFEPLLAPRSVTPDELNVDRGNGLFDANLENYSKYHAEYVKIENSTVINVTEAPTGRPNWTVSSSGSLVPITDTGLRFRNDRFVYRTGYNYRRAEGTVPGAEGAFTPPASGSVVDVSGFMTLNNFNPDANLVPGSAFFKINPFEDGVLWQGETETEPGQKFVNGQDLGGGIIFEWPNDLSILGSPPFVSNFATVPDTTVIASGVQYQISADIVAEGAKTVTGVNVVYTASGQAQVVAPMTNTGGDTYSFTFPVFSDFSTVTYTIEATDSQGLTGQFPTSGSLNFFVDGGAITSIEVIQKPGSESTGPSPLAGLGVLQMNIEAIVVSDILDGVIAVHDINAAGQPWSGVYLEETTANGVLRKGDIITITAAAVQEAAVTSNSTIFITALTNVEFDIESNGNDTAPFIPSLFTSDVLALQANAEIEAYEGMLIRFDNATFINELGFGEFEVANQSPSETELPTEGIIFNEDTRTPLIGETGFPADVNIHLRDGVVFNSISGLMFSSFGSHKVIPRDLNDLQGANFSHPRLQFDLIFPEDGASLGIESDADQVDVTWESTTDYDGDAVTYEFVLYTLADTAIVVIEPSNNNGEFTTFTADEIDTFLSVERSLALGESETFLWNVRVSDGSDTLSHAASYDFGAQVFITGFFELTLTRGLAVSIEDDQFGVPTEFSLQQNYPNPFNPSTNINFALPQASRVTLTVYNMLGQKIATLLNGDQRAAGSHTITFDAAGLASGMYIYRIDAGSFTSTKTMMLIK